VLAESPDHDATEQTVEQEASGHGSGATAAPTADPDDIRISELPKEVGVMLIAAGIVGLILPGPGTPAVIAGGLALWPNAFGKLESWLEGRYPEVHKEGMRQVRRYLRDLEKRYPNSTHR
jgi:hypothetical protein